MLMIVLRILSILGILLLALLALAVTILLLVLFVPVTYRISGGKDEEGFRIRLKVKWLLGFFRLQYGYPEPGEVAAKILFFTLYRMKIPPDKAELSGEKADTKENKKKKTAPDAEASKTNAPKTAARKKGAFLKNSSGKPAGEGATQKNPSIDAATEETMRKAPSTETAAEETTEKNPSAKTAMEETTEKKPSAETAAEETTEKNPSTEAAEEELSGIGKILQKFRKIKYTIHSIYDKIKEIWNNISYYLELLQEEETRQLFSHIRLRTGRIIKSVWPGHIRADILFGTGSPDTTGYLYGAYCMLSPMLRADICVTPDFEEAVLKADFVVSGHIAVWVLVVNACRIAMDKRLRRLIRKAVAPGIKAAGKKAA